MAKTKQKLAPLHIVQPEPEVIKLDIGCGKNAAEGFVGIDALDFGQKHVHDVRKGLPFPDDSISEVRSSHFVEHLTGTERVSFFNELYRVMKVGATAQIVTPHWSHACAYGDPTHQWAPMSEWWPFYVNKNWREGWTDDKGNVFAANAPHVPFTCDFDFVTAGSWDQKLAGRNPEFVQNSMNTQVNAWRDLIITLTKRAKVE